MGDLARQISAAKMRGKDTSALQSQYDAAKSRYDSATAQINAPKQLTTTAARQEKFDQRQTLIEEAAKQAQLQSNLEKEQRDGYNRTVQEKADIYNSVAHDQLSGLNRTIDEKGLRTVVEDQNRGYQRTLQEKQKQIAASIEHDQQSGYKRTEDEKRDKTLGGKIFTMLGAGLGQFNSSIAGLADAAATAVETVGSYLNGGFTKDGKFVKGDAAFTKSLMEPIHTWADYTRNTSDALNEQSARNWNQTAAGSIANTIGTGVIAALPQAALALMTLGTSSAGTLTQASSGLAGSIETAMQRIANDPSYWLSFMQETGSNFTEAKAAGATDEEAVLSATIAGLANAAIEVGGGLENNDWMNDGTLSALSKAKNLVKGAVEEGSEELIQNPISRAMQKLVYDGDRQWLSFDNTAQGRDAVFNPYQSAEEFATGAAVGGILGAGNFALSRAMNARAQNTGNTNADTDVLLDQAIQDASRPDVVQNTQLTQDEMLDAAMRAANRGETLTAPGQTANQTTQQTTQAVQERGTGDVITVGEINKNSAAPEQTTVSPINGPVRSDAAEAGTININYGVEKIKSEFKKLIEKNKGYLSFNQLVDYGNSLSNEDYRRYGKGSSITSEILLRAAGAKKTIKQDTDQDSVVVNTSQEQPDIFSGLVFCADCGKPLVLHRASTMKKVEYNFKRYTYGKKGKTACTAHHIRECELTQIVLDDLCRVTHFARMKERQFAAHINQKNSAELRREMNRVLRELDAMKKRSAELSKLFKRLYEDNVLGRVTDEQYRMLSGDYTDEQRMLEEQIPQKEQRLAQLQAREANVDAFIEKAK